MIHRRHCLLLTIAGKGGDYPLELWSALIKELPEETNPQLKREFLNQISKLPQATIVELRSPLAIWLEQNLAKTLKFDDNLGWRVYDHIVDGILSGGPEATTRSELKILSRQTYGYAIRGPVEMFAKALLDTIPSEEQETNLHISGHIKTRFERLFEAPREGSNHAVTIVSRELNWLLTVDTDWTKERIIPMLDFNHPASEHAWNGFLRMAIWPSSQLAEIIKPMMLELFPRIEKFKLNQYCSNNAACLLGIMRIFYSNKPGGLTSR